MAQAHYPDRNEWRVALVAVIAVGAFVVAQLVIDWLTAQWDRRLHW